MVILKGILKKDMSLNKQSSKQNTGNWFIIYVTILQLNYQTDKSEIKKLICPWEIGMKF